MKVPPKRKGNIIIHRQHDSNVTASMKVPPKRKGNIFVTRRCKRRVIASMKVPPKRKGNNGPVSLSLTAGSCLNESPSEKEGKSGYPRQ